MLPCYKILIVDDDKDILEFLGYNLKKENFLVYTSETGRDAVRKAYKYIPHIIFLDIILPDIDGIEVCQEIRKNEELKHSVIVFLTGRKEDYTQIAGYDAGADDYIIKPVRPRLILSKIKALLKRHPDYQKTEQAFYNNDIRIIPEAYSVMVNGKEISLPKKEFELLALLVSSPDKVFTREEISKKLWQEDLAPGSRSIDVHIRRIRKKIKINNIKTYKGVGYKFVM